LLFGLFVYKNGRFFVQKHNAKIPEYVLTAKGKYAILSAKAEFF